MRKAVLLAIVLIGIIVLAFMYGRMQLFAHRLELKAYFENAQGLRAGAPVRLAGVNVGSVVSVRARPDMKGNAAEIALALNTPYELKVPGDSVVSLATAGMLGETFADRGAGNDRPTRTERRGTEDKSKRRPQHGAVD